VAFSIIDKLTLQSVIFVLCGQHTPLHKIRHDSLQLLDILVSSFRELDVFFELPGNLR